MSCTCELFQYSDSLKIGYFNILKRLDSIVSGPARDYGAGYSSCTSQKANVKNFSKIWWDGSGFSAGRNRACLNNVKVELQCELFQYSDSLEIGNSTFRSTWIAPFPVPRGAMALVIARVHPKTQPWRILEKSDETEGFSARVETGAVWITTR